MVKASSPFLHVKVLVPWQCLHSGLQGKGRKEEAITDSLKQGPSDRQIKFKIEIALSSIFID